MGREQAHQFYDDIFANSPKYALPVEESKWYSSWLFIADRVAEVHPDIVIDLGCGPGHFAEILSKHLKHGFQYVGYDFSPVAIEQASIRMRGDPRFSFEKADLKAKNFNEHIQSHQMVMYLAFEFLEHVRWDRKVMRRMYPGFPVMITLPTFDDAGHARHFRKINRALRRYRCHITIEESCELDVGKHFMIRGKSRRARWVIW